MKISVFSDLHFGYAYRLETENDSFENAGEAIEKSTDSDLILLAGDIFDVRVPTTDTWAKAMSVLSKIRLRQNSGVKLVSSTKQLEEISKKSLEHQPLVVIHGNHERRSRSEFNTVQALENAGLLIHIDKDTMIFERDGKKVAIHGMSSVPERYAKQTLQEWNPRPIPGCVNILMMHQSIDPFVFSPLEPPSLKLNELPKGFDIVINGHIHSHTVENVNGTTFFIPGSTVITQMEKSEAETPKGIMQININDKVDVQFVPLESNRKFLYEEVNLVSKTTLRDQVEVKVNGLLFKKNFSKLPLIKLRITGKETEVIENELRELQKKYHDRAILVFSKDLESPEITSKIEFLRNLIEQKSSVEEIGLNTLRKNLEELKFESSFDYENIFELLSENDTDKASAILLGEQKTFSNFFGR